MIREIYKVAQTWRPEDGDPLQHNPTAMRCIEKVRRMYSTTRRKQARSGTMVVDRPI